MPFLVKPRSITANQVPGISVYKEVGFLTQRSPPPLTLPTTPHLLYPSFCGRHLHAPRETGSLRRSCYRRCHFPRCVESARVTPNALSHLLSLLSPTFSTTIHPQLVPLPLYPVATCCNSRYGSSSSRGLVQRSDPAVIP